jgi:hypothetical protein
MFLAQYKVLRENGHSPSEAFNETVEEATQSLFPLIGQYGMVSRAAFIEASVIKLIFDCRTICMLHAPRRLVAVHLTGHQSLKRRIVRYLRL